MAKSAKAKKVKKSEFQKPKLKVGKTRPKNENFTDTSFRSRNINVLQQSLSTSVPSVSAQFTHHLNLLNHKSESQRRESLAHLTSALHATNTLPLPIGTVLSKVQPLVLDTSNAVRTQCVRLLEALPQDLVRDNAEKLLLYCRAALTHLSTRVRLTGLELLEWLLNTSGAQVVSCPGGWTRTLSCLLSLLGWSSQDPSRKAAAHGWTAPVVSSSRGVKSEVEIKAHTQQLQVLALFLKTGLADKDRVQRDAKGAVSASMDWPVWQWTQHRIPRDSSSYTHLNLFGELRADASDLCPSVEERRRLYERHATELRRGLERAKNEGGGVGRAAMNVDKMLRSCGY